jgi:hypothetical protein
MVVILNRRRECSNKCRFVSSLLGAPGNRTDPEGPVKTAFVERVGRQETGEIACADPFLRALKRAEDAAGKGSTRALKHPHELLR